jgi:hypothetical protein
VWCVLNSIDGRISGPKGPLYTVHGLPKCSDVFDGGTLKQGTMFVRSEATDKALISAVTCINLKGIYYTLY